MEWPVEAMESSYADFELKIDVLDFHEVLTLGELFD